MLEIEEYNRRFGKSMGFLGELLRIDVAKIASKLYIIFKAKPAYRHGCLLMVRKVEELWTDANLG